MDDKDDGVRGPSAGPDASASRHPAPALNDAILSEQERQHDGKAEAIVRLLEERATREKELEEDIRQRRARVEKSAQERKEGRRTTGRGEKTRHRRRRDRSRSPPRRRSERRRSRSRTRRQHRSRSRRHHRSRSPRRDRKKSRSRSSSSRSIEYGGYIPRKRTAPSGFDDTSKGAFQAHTLQDIGRLQQGFSPLPCPTRQVYVGNLVPGLVSDMALRQLFNSALSAAFPNASRPGSEPVVSVSMHSDGRYAFVELRSPEMATAALQLSGQVQLFGQSISVGRPSGYVDPGKAAAAAQAAAVALAAFNKGEVSAQQTFGAISAQQTPTATGTPVSNAAIASPASAFISIEGLVDLKMLSADEAYANIVKSLRNECIKYGPVIQLKIPRPADPGMAKFADASTAMRAKEGLMAMATGDKNVAINYVSQEVFSAIL